MTNLINLYTEETKILLEAVTKTGLPLVIDGDTGSGASTLAEYLRDSSNYGLIDGVNGFDGKEEEAMIALYKSLRHVNGDKIIIVKRSISTNFADVIGKFIKIKTFRNSTTGERYIHIIPSSSITRMVHNLLGPSNPLVLIVGRDSKSFRSDISNQPTALTMDIESEDDLKSFIETMVRGMEISMKHSNKDKFSDVVGSGIVVFKINLDKIKSDYAYEFLKTVHANPTRLSIYIQGYITNFESIEPRFHELFPKKIF